MKEAKTDRHRRRALASARLAVLAVAAGLLAGCGGAIKDSAPPAASVDPSRIPDAVPRDEPRSRYGNPTSYEVFGRRYHVMGTSAGYVERGIASWYGRKFHGRRASSGETYDMYAMTAAHKTLPLPTYVRVTNLENRRSVVLKVNDRGPFHENRIIDLSYSAARKLDIVRKGTGYVEVRAVGPGTDDAAARTVVARSPDAPGAERDSLELYLQAGSFAVRANAERLGERLVQLAGPLVRIVEAISNGRRVYRVRLGPLAGVEAADRLALSLLNLGLEPPRIVIE